MNYLLLRRDGDALTLALCVEGPALDCVLQGHLQPTGVGVLTDGTGHHLATVSAATLLEGLAQALAWVSARNLRVDAVVHIGAMHEEPDGVVCSTAAVRLTDPELAQRSPLKTYGEIESAYRVVSAWRAECAQLLIRTRRQVDSPFLIGAIVKQGVLAPPPTCPHRAKVRCETCPRAQPA